MQNPLSLKRLSLPKACSSHHSFLHFSPARPPARPLDTPTLASTAPPDAERPLPRLRQTGLTPRLQPRSAFSRRSAILDAMLRIPTDSPSPALFSSTLHFAAWPRICLPAPAPAHARRAGTSHRGGDSDGGRTDGQAGTGQAGRVDHLAVHSGRCTWLCKDCCWRMTERGMGGVGMGVFPG